MIGHTFDVQRYNNPIKCADKYRVPGALMCRPFRRLSIVQSRPPYSLNSAVLLVHLPSLNEDGTFSFAAAAFADTWLFYPITPKNLNKTKAFSVLLPTR